MEFLRMLRGQRSKHSPRCAPAPRPSHTSALFTGWICTLTFLWSGSPAWAQAASDSAATLKKLSVEQLMDIEITSVSKRPEKLSEAASAIQVITQEDIRRSGATTLPEALRLATNLEVAQIDSRQWAISARGFNSTTANKLLVLVDGRTVYTPLYAGVFWDVQDTLLENIEQIEVISGPGATLWGANAVNGVINISTKAAAETPGLLLTASAGDELQKAGGLRYGGNIGAQFDYRFHAKYVDHDHALLANGRAATNAWQMTQGGFRLDGRLTERDTLTVQGDAYQARIAQPAFDAIAASGGNILGRWSRSLAPQSDMQLQLYLDRTHRRIPGSYTENLDTLDVDFQHRLPLAPRHDLVWGGSFRYIDDNIINPVQLAFTPPHVKRVWYSAFVQDDIALITNQLNLTLGTKVEHNEYTGYELQPSARLAWRPNELNTLWSAVSRAIRTPSRIDGELVAPSTPPYTVLVPNPDFESEKLLAYELGYRVQPLPSLSASLSFFYDDYDDIRSIEHVNSPLVYPLLVGNGLTAKSHGAELSAEYTVTDRWRLQAGYTALRISFAHKPGSTDTNPGTNEAHDPQQHWSLRSSLDLPHGFALDATYRHVSRIADQQVPAYGELDVRVGWQLRDRLEVAITGQNLLHAHHAEFGAAASRQEIERSLNGKISWHF